jgi:hypothetical protein
MEGGLTAESASYFLPGGLLVLRNIKGLVTSWENDVLFAGKVVPRHITVKAVDRNLLTAEVTVEAAGPVDPEAIGLPGGPAEAGMTLRPIQRLSKPPEVVSADFAWPDNDSAAVSLFGVLDRTGRFRELEVILGLKAHNIGKVMESFRKERSRPAEIDGSPCEMPVYGLAASISQGEIMGK